MDRRISCFLVAFLLVFISMEATFVMGDGNGNGNGNGDGENNGNGNGNGNSDSNNGNGNGNGNGSGNGNGNGNGNGKPTNESKEYDIEDPVNGNQVRAKCKLEGQCKGRYIECPAECPDRKPKQNKKQKGCYVDCNSKCEATCRFRKAKCTGYGSVCYDPRFVGGDGVMFYFHGSKGGNFALVSDDQLHINAHFIGTRPQGRTRDFTWIQALNVMFDSHSLVVAAKRVTKWDDNVDAVIVRWDGQEIEVPTDGEAEWRINDGKRNVVVERTDDTNNVRVSVSGLVEMDVRVTPIGAEENRVHKYELPISDDAFAHLETQFRFSNLSDLVEGVLGKTYRPDYVSPVKVGVPMPMMGGEDKYQTPSLLSPLCDACKFRGGDSAAVGGAIEMMVAQY